MKAIILLLVLCLALVVPVHAVIYSNIVTTDQTVGSSGQEVIPQQVCACGLTVDSFKVVNHKDTAAKYVLEVSGDAAPYATVYPPVFTLPPNGEIEVTTNLKFPCTVGKSYVLSTQVNELGGVQKTITKAYLANQCPNIQVFSREAFIESNPCTSETFRFDITNAGKHKDVFTFRLSEDSSNAKLSSDGVVLSSGQTHTLFINTKFACNVSGRKDFTLITETRDSDLRATTPFSLNIKPNYDFALGVPKKVKLCEQVNDSLSIKLLNPQPFNDTFTVVLSGIDWVNDKLSTEVESESESVIDFPITAPKGSKGTYTIEAKSSSYVGNLEVTNSFDVDVDACYGINMFLLRNVSKICCDEDAVYAQISNTGSEPTTLDLKLDSNAILSLEKTELRLNAHESKVIKLFINQSVCPMDASFNLKAVPRNAPAFARELSATYSFIAKEDCSKIEASKTNFDVNYRSASFEIPLKNVGARETYYSFNLKSGSWESLETFDALLKPDETTNVRVYIAPQDISEGKYALTLVAETPKGDSFSIPLLLSLNKKFRFNDLMWETYVYVVNYPCHFTYRLISIIFLIVLLVLIVCALWARSTRKIRRRAKLKKISWSLFYFLFVLLLAGGLTVLICNQGIQSITTYVPDNLSADQVSSVVESPANTSNASNTTNMGLNLNISNISITTGGVSQETEEGGAETGLSEGTAGTENESSGELPSMNESVSESEEKVSNAFSLSIPKGENFKINLSEIFSDPDADVLYYTIVGPSSLDIKVDNDEAIADVTVAEDFKEGSTITVTVSDGEYTIASPPIELVYESEDGSSGSQGSSELVKSSDSSDLSDSSNNSQGNSSPIKGVYVYVVLVLIIVILFIRVMYDQQKEKQEEKKKQEEAKKKKSTVSAKRGSKKKKAKKK